ncbi:MULTISPECIES: OmpA family protein [unclassified Empedobacter]|uniref:OmpA family protein n=1 Tax=unclassified Empedobacter TaxID=2643773 RepID=UPI0024474236|nr:MULTISPECIES: OmpA family protein [unclassified Empedobacter]MDH0659702.1 OmpA family protein [Empedobacter sp. GD03865]MDH0673341.1 OmpA family protein [Empedobacter sp. GD03861]
MKKINTKIAAIVLGGSFMMSSCTAVQNANNTQKGAGIGAVAGGVLGGLIGKGAGGALIGAAVGGAAGGVIGNNMDKQAQKIEQVLPGAEVVRTEEGINLILDENSKVTFDYNKSSLTSTAKANLDKLIEVFKEYPDTDLLVIGYTDNVGSQSYNKPLSEQRAQSVKDYLISKGIASSRLTSTGKGIEDPIADNSTAEGRAKNRRVEVTITANEKMKADAAKEANGQ